MQKDRRNIYKNLNNDKENSKSKFKEPDLENKETGLAEAAGQVLATQNDPLNKTLRGIADHISSKVHGQRQQELNKEANNSMENTQEKRHQSVGYEL